MVVVCFEWKTDDTISSSCLDTESSFLFLFLFIPFHLFCSVLPLSFLLSSVLYLEPKSNNFNNERYHPNIVYVHSFFMVFSSSSSLSLFFFFFFF